MRYNPFNPQQPARPDFFVGREPEITQFEKYLSQTTHNSPMNMSITGNRGIGKTSVLVKFESIAKNNRCLVLRLSNYEGNVSNIMEFGSFIVSNLRRELLSKKPLSKIADMVTSLKPTVSWQDVSISIEKKDVIEEILRQRLRKIWEETKEDYDAIVILIDEAESLEKIEGILPLLREIFQRLSTEANYMIVLAGKLNFPERMSESFSPLNRFFPVHRLAPFNCEEIKTYVDKKLKTVNVTIADDALQYIAQKSEGHPYVLVSMMYTILDTLNDKESDITMETVSRATEKTHATLEQDFFSPMYHPLTPKAKEVINVIAENIISIKFSFREAVVWTKMERNYVSPYIQELLRKGILNKPERGQYEVFHSLFLDYIRRQVISENKRSAQKTLDVSTA